MLRDVPRRPPTAQDHLPAFFAEAPDGLAIVDADLQFVYVNEAFARMNGIAADAHQGKTVQDILPKMARIIEPVMRLVLATGTPAVDFEVAGEVPGHPGEPHAWVVSFFPLRDGKGLPAWIGALVVDVTGLKREEERLTRSLLDERRFRVVIESSSDGIALVSPDGIVLYSSPSTSRITGYEPAEFIGRSGFELVHPEDLDRMKALLAKLAHEPGGRLSAETRVRHRDGSWRWVEAIGTNLIDEPSVHAIVVNYRDITERKRAEEAVREANDKLLVQANRLERRNRELSLLREMGELLQACQTNDEAYQVIKRSAREFFADCSGAVYMVNSGHLAEPVAVWGPNAGDEDVFTQDECWALRRGSLHTNLGDASESDLLCRHLGTPPPPVSLCVPMVGRGETLGVLNLRFETADPQPVETYRQLAPAVAERIVLAIDNLNLRESLRVQSIRDPLTGLFNRRYMEASLERELRRADRQRQPIGVIVFDLDHFKSVNDTYGHEAGDVVLAAFGDFLQSRVRKEDIPCRFGGEEFLLILPGASLEDTVARAEQLREESRRMAISHRGRPLGPLTLSLGVAVFPDHGLTGEALIRVADRALYRAKELGRDRVEIAAGV